MTRTSPEVLGSTLRSARERANLSQEDLADRLGVAPRTVAAWESESPPHPWPRHRAALERFVAEVEGRAA